MKKVIIIFYLSLTLLNLSCHFKAEENVPRTVEIQSVQDEVSLLTETKELDLLNKSSEEIVDWKLSREFAEFTLVGLMSDNSFPQDSSIWDYPIAIYDAKGQIKYYEYRIMSQDRTVGAITCNANEKQGLPIAYIIHTEGYADEIEKLYNKGNFSNNNLPRIIDNGYPEVLVAASKIKRNGEIEFDKVFDLINGDEINKIEEPVVFDDYIKENPDFFSDAQIKEIRRVIKEYEEEIAAIWSEAKKNQGNIITRGWGGNSGSSHMDDKKQKVMTETEFNSKYSTHRYGKSYWTCGGSTAGYILDTLALKGLGNVSEKWLKMSNAYNLPYYEKSECIMHLIDIMEMVPFYFNQDNKVLNQKEVDYRLVDGWITWPCNIGNAIRMYSDYDVSYTCGIPKKSIDNGVPGISLRVGIDSLHYRNVVAYETRGWWIFKWDYELIKDLNNIDDGNWEAWNPLYHWMSWNVVHK